MKMVAGGKPLTKNKQKASKHKGMTPLMLAAKSGSLSCVQELLKARAHVNARDEDRMRPLHFAALSGELRIAVELMTYSADPLRLDDEQRGPADCLPDELRRQPGELRRWTEALENNRGNETTNNGIDQEADSDREQQALISPVKASSSLPVEAVSWHDIQASRATAVPTGYRKV
mmetsp:Transcript_36861/g.70883  ORF Transcript_36861/g.70883 Transcript_36861/m.70883 type:complete len:175 (+) Transcript_36861:2-526(+)